MIRCDYRPLFRETRRANSKRVGGVYAIQKSCLRLRYYRPRQEGGGSYSHVRAYEKLQPFHHLDVKFNAIRAILLRSDAFSFNAIRYPLSLSLPLSHTLRWKKREGERALVKIEAWKITVTKRKRGSISRGRARIGEIRIGITGHRLRERTRKGAGNRGHRRLSTPRSRGDP